MWAAILRLLGTQVGRATVKEAAKEVIKKYGVQAAKTVFKNISPEELAKMSKDEILELAKRLGKETGRRAIDDKVFSRSNAKKLAEIANKGIDVVETKTRQYLENRSLNLLNRRLVDALGRSGIDASGRVIAPKIRSRLYTKARGFASDTLEGALFPQTPRQAFGVYYLRGIIGEGTASAINSLLLGVPRAALATPKARAFLRFLTTEVRYLRSVGQVRSASQLYGAVKKASKYARNLYGEQQPLWSYKAAGYISGRLTVPLATTYVFVDKDERKKNIQKLQNSIKPFVKNKVRTYVNAYVRSDGVRVKGHYRTYTAA